MTDTRIPAEQVGARMEIMALIARYCHAVDRCDWSMFEDVFTEDVVADYSSVEQYTGGVAKLDGRANLVEWFEKSMKHIGPGLTHYMTNCLIDMHGGEATVMVHNHVLNASMGAVYNCRAIDTPEGWRIAELNFEVRYFDDVVSGMSGYMEGVDGRSV